MNCFVKRSLMLMALMAAFAMAQADTTVGQLCNEEALATVDLSTGEFIIELGNFIGVIGIEDTDGAAIFDISAFDATTPLGPAGLLASDGIGFLGLTPFPAGVFNLGPIIDEPFRTDEGIEDLVVQFAIAGPSQAQLLTVGNGITVINSIPEPGSLSLLALASLGVVVRRRR